MKKLFVTISAAIFAMASFTSCDTDEIRGMELSGEWQGDFDMYYEIPCHEHGVDTYYADKTYLQFLPSNNSPACGTGYQEDYYYDVRSPYDVVYHYFTWEIRYGNIYLYYRDEGEWDTILHNYSLNNSHFTGYFGDTNNYFDLIKLSSYNWYRGYESDGYYYHDRDGYYLAPKRGGERAESATNEKPRIIRYGNAAMDGKVREK